MELFDIALKATSEEFQTESLKWLQKRIGFDGVIWGGGKRLPGGGLCITQSYLSGRPEGLVLDYPSCASGDPVSQRFLETPNRLQNISTHKLYRSCDQEIIRQYLDHYRVRQLQLVGLINPTTSAYSWLVFYREEENRPFSPALEAITKNAVSMVLLAEQFHSSAHQQLTLESQIVGHYEREPLIPHLTKRQLQVLHYVEQGWPNKLIAHHLSISENTLKTHLKILFRVLGVQSRSQALIAGRTLRDQAQVPVDFDRL